MCKKCCTFVAKYKIEGMKYRQTILVILGTILIMLAASTIYSVSAGNRGIVLRFGRIHKIATPGWHFRIPIVDKVFPMPLSELSHSVYVRTFTADGKNIEISWRVLYSIEEDNLLRVFTAYRDKVAQNLLFPTVAGLTEEIVANYTLPELIANNNAIVDSLNTQVKSIADSKGITMHRLYMVRWNEYEEINK